MKNRTLIHSRGKVGKYDPTTMQETLTHTNVPLHALFLCMPRPARPKEEGKRSEFSTSGDTLNTPRDAVTHHHNAYRLPRLSAPYQPIGVSFHLHPLLQRIILPFEGHCPQGQEVYLAI